MDILDLNVMVSYQIQWHFCDGTYPWVNIANIDGTHKEALWFAFVNIGKRHIYLNTIFIMY